MYLVITVTSILVLILIFIAIKLYYTHNVVSRLHDTTHDFSNYIANMKNNLKQKIDQPDDALFREAHVYMTLQEIKDTMKSGARIQEETIDAERNARTTFQTNVKQYIPVMQERLASEINERKASEHEMSNILHGSINTRQYLFLRGEGDLNNLKSSFDSNDAALRMNMNSYNDTLSKNIDKHVSLLNDQVINVLSTTSRNVSYGFGNTSNILFSNDVNIKNNIQSFDKEFSTSYANVQSAKDIYSTIYQEMAQNASGDMARGNKWITDTVLWRAKQDDLILSTRVIANMNSNLLNSFSIEANDQVASLRRRNDMLDKQLNTMSEHVNTVMATFEDTMHNEDTRVNNILGAFDTQLRRKDRNRSTLGVVLGGTASFNTDINNNVSSIRLAQNGLTMKNYRIQNDVIYSTSNISKALTTSNLTACNIIMSPGSCINNGQYDGICFDDLSFRASLGVPKGKLLVDKVQFTSRPDGLYFHQAYNEDALQSLAVSSLTANVLSQNVNVTGKLSTMNAVIDSNVNVSQATNVLSDVFNVKNMNVASTLKIGDALPSFERKKDSLNLTLEKSFQVGSGALGLDKNGQMICKGFNADSLVANGFLNTAALYGSNIQVGGSDYTLSNIPLSVVEPAPSWQTEFHGEDSYVRFNHPDGHGISINTDVNNSMYAFSVGVSDVARPDFSVNNTGRIEAKRICTKGFCVDQSKLKRLKDIHENYAIVFTKPNFTGKKMLIKVGTYLREDDLKKLQFNDNIQSIWVGKNVKSFVYQTKDRNMNMMSGSASEVRPPGVKVLSSDMINTISEIEVMYIDDAARLATGPMSVIMFDQFNLMGNKLVIDDIGYYHNLWFQTRNFVNKTRSIYVPKGRDVELWEKPFRQGQRMRIKGPNNMKDQNIQMNVAEILIIASQSEP